MGTYHVDLQDIFFNLFDVNQAQERAGELGEDGLKEIMEELGKFVGNEIYPTREKGDVEGVTLKDKQVIVPQCFQKANKLYYENGWYAVGQPEEIGGVPVPNSVEVACNSLVMGANVAFSMYAGLTKGCMNVIRAVGSDDQNAKYIDKMMEGIWGGTMCLTEASAGSDVGACRTVAKPLDGNMYSIKGVKVFISSGDSDLYENNIHLVLARTPDAPAGPKGLSLFIVPKVKINQDGSLADSNHVVCTKIEEKMGLHGSSTCELTFGDGGECVGEMIGKEMEGMGNMFLMMNDARLSCGVQGESQANLAFHQSEKYANERVQFGTEIINHPDVKRTLLKMRAMTRGMRALSLYTANLFDLAEAGDPTAEPEISLLTPICKSYMTDEAFQVTVDAIQVHGGYGYCQEYGVEQFARDVKIASLYEGTNGIQAIDFLMRKLLKDQGKQFLLLGQKIVKTMESSIAQEFTSENQLISKSLEKSQLIMQKFGKMAAEKNFNGILAFASDFLRFSGNVVVAWRLLDHACIAREKLAKGSCDDEFCTSKVTDFKIFCQHKLVENIGIGHSILNFEEDLVNLSL